MKICREVTDLAKLEQNTRQCTWRTKCIALFSPHKQSFRFRTYRTEEKYTSWEHATMLHCKYTVYLAEDSMCVTVAAEEKR
jgi:hypothetical protein